MSDHPDPSDSDDQLDPEQLLSAWALGLLESDAAAAIEREVRSTPAMRRRARRLAATAAVVSATTTPYEDDPSMPQIELRLVQRARDARPPAIRPRPYARALVRVSPWLLALSVMALVVSFGWLAFQPDEPISGRAIPLADDGAIGVLLPRYESRGFALVFWGLPELAANETWQLWYVRESGAVEPGPLFAADADGRAAVALDPNELETDDPLLGFAVSRDDPGQRAGATASRDDILYQFPSR